MIARRNLLAGILGACAAPAIVRASSLMVLPTPPKILEFPWYAPAGLIKGMLYTTVHDSYYFGAVTGRISASRLEWQNFPSSNTPKRNVMPSSRFPNLDLSRLERRILAL